MTETFTVRFDSNALESPEYIGPFYSEDDAQDYADDRNSSLALSGIPSSVACYSVVWLIMNTTDILSVREQIQEDLICLLESQFGEVDYLDEVKSLACQIVVDNFNQLKWESLFWLQL